VIELDGSQHAQPEQAAFDARRTQYLEAAGFRVLRIWCSDLFKERDGVMETIWNALKARESFSPCGRRWRERSERRMRGAATPSALWRLTPLTRAPAKFEGVGSIPLPQGERSKDVRSIRR
jgi:hypothetical protein